jgi:hypothetical protein
MCFLQRVRFALGFACSISAAILDLRRSAVKTPDRMGHHAEFIGFFARICFAKIENWSVILTFPPIPPATQTPPSIAAMQSDRQPGWGQAGAA